VGALAKPKEKPILLIQPRIFLKSVLYNLVVQDGCFYFCKIGHGFGASTEQECRYHAGMAESELLSEKGSFKLPMESVVKIHNETKRSPWTAAFDNHGTVYFMDGKRTIKFILCGQTLVETLRERLEANGFNRVTLLENAGLEGFQEPADKKEDRKNAERLTRISHGFNWLTILVAVWMLLLPFAFPSGTALSMLLPITALLVCWRYRRFLQSKTRNSEKIRSFLSIPILLPPLILSIWVLINLNVIYSLLFFGALAVFTLLCIGFILYRHTSLRSKAWAGILVLFLFSYSYSGVLVTNNMACLQPVAHYIAVIENKRTRFSYRATIHYLDLSPWGNHHDENSISVGLPLYYEASIGDTLTISQERGLWGIEWYRMNLVKQK
jgi:hypothetical protein